MNHHAQHKYHLKTATKKEKAFLDKLIYPVSIIFPLITIPQIVEIWVNQSAADVSLFTWAGWWALSFLYTLWAIVDGVKPLIISQGLWQLVYLAMFASIIRFS